MCWSYLENEVVVRSTLINNQVITFKLVFVTKDRVSNLNQGYDFFEFHSEDDDDYEVKVLNMIKLYGKPIRSVNDVLVGTIFYGARLYMQNAEKGSSNAHSTALVLLNMRVIKTHKKLDEMVKPDAESLWGNQFGFLHIPVPKSDDVEIADPLEFVYKAKETIKNKRGSLAVFLTGTLIEFI